MKVRVVFWVKRQLFTTYGPIEEVFNETIIDMGDMGVIVWDKEPMFRKHYWSVEKYLKDRFEYSVADMESDIEIVDLGEF